MTPLLLPYPEIDPVLVQLGPFAIRWYALAYIAGLVIGWQIMRRVSQQPPVLPMIRKPDDGEDFRAKRIDDFLLWAALGVILGGRLGYVLFYKPVFFVSNPLQIFTLWEGGMSFHGGLLGVILAILIFALRNGVPPLMMSDLVAIVAPIGLFFGRLANFINGELWGRVADVPWAMIFPRGGPLPRHPSQLYQATFEGILLFALVFAVWKLCDARRRPGLLTGTFCMGYGAARIAGEFFREPDSFMGFLLGTGWLTMGMLLSLPVLLFGLALIVRAQRAPAVAA
jgi:phosphatidylglycerol:prolipoprotein diacylglycerol transferase